MKKLLYLTLALFLLNTTVTSAQVTIPAPKKEVTAESLGATQLSQVDKFPADQQEMIKACIAYVIAIPEENTPAEEYYAKVGSTSSNEVVIKLWHKTAFKVINDAQKMNIKISGNPGGKCKDLHYDKSEGVVTKWVRW
jgi:hypothetical protein